MTLAFARHSGRQMGLGLVPITPHTGEPTLVGAIESVSQSGLVKGWAFDTAYSGPTHSVQIYANGAPIASGSTGESRPDVAAAYQAPSADNAGFSIQLPASAAGQTITGTVDGIPLEGSLSFGSTTNTTTPPATTPPPTQTVPQGSTASPAATTSGVLDSLKDTWANLSTPVKIGGVAVVGYLLLGAHKRR